MKTFITDDFLLKGTTARQLYHEYAAPMPIIDYHNHLSPSYIWQNYQFRNLTEAWLAGDHYKWRAMRANGIAEAFCTGTPAADEASDWAKFEQWANTVPYTLRNPLYHWTHLELLRYFSVDELLTRASARRIYDVCSEKLQSPEFRAQGLLKRMNVTVVATTDDPADCLTNHLHFQNPTLRLVPTLRPDKAMMPIFWPPSPNATTLLRRLGAGLQTMAWNRSEPKT